MFLDVMTLKKSCKLQGICFHIDLYLDQTLRYIIYIFVVFLFACLLLYKYSYGFYPFNLLITWFDYNLFQPFYLPLCPVCVQSLVDIASFCNVDQRCIRFYLHIGDFRDTSLRYCMFTCFLTYLSRACTLKILVHVMTRRI